MYFDDFFILLLIIAAVGVGSITFILSIVLFRRTSHLKKRIVHMEQYLQEKTAHLASHEEHVHEEQHRAVAEQVARQEVEKIEQQVFPKESAEPSAFERFGVWLKTDWLMKLGAFLIILGMMWFVNYAIEEFKIGPMGRVAIGLTFGALVIALGRYRMNRFISQGSILMFAGALIVVFTAKVGYTPEYNVFTQSSALMLMFLTSCVLGFMSVLFSYKPLAYGNIAIAAVAPLLVANPDPNFAGLMTYLLVLSVGAVWVAGYKGWRGLILTSLVTVFAYSMSFYETALYAQRSASSYRNAERFVKATEYADTGLMFCFIFSALFFAISILGMRVIRKVNVADLLTAALTGLYLLLWIFAGVEEHWQSLVLIMWTLVFGLGAFTAVRLGAKLPYFFTYLGVGVVLLGTATAVELEGEALTIAYILEATLLILVGYKIVRSVKLLWLLALPSVVPLMMVFGSMNSRVWARDGIFSDTAFVLYTLLAALGYLFSCFYREVQKGGTALTRARNITFIMLLVYGTLTIWQVCMGLFSVELVDSYARKGFSYYGRYNYDAGVMVALFIYTAAALYFYVRSRIAEKRWMRWAAISYLTIVVGRLLLVEVWGMELLFRFVTFFIIGSLIIAVAWYEKSSKRVSAPVITSNTNNKHE